MIRPMIRRTAAVAAVLCACRFAAAAAPTANPAYDGWAKCKPGAMTKIDSQTEVMGQTTKMTLTTKLLEITPEKAVVEIKTSMEMMGQKMDQPATKQEIPAKTPDMKDMKMPAGIDPTKMPKPTMGKETITVAGKSYDCTTTEVNTEMSGMKVHSKTWTSADVPGGMVKMTSSTEGATPSKTTMTLVEYSDGK